MRNLPFHFTRRRFVKIAALAASTTGLPSWFLDELDSRAATTRPLSPNDRPGIALIGCGGRGRGITKLASSLGDVIAVCDVDKKHLEAAAQQFTVDSQAPAQYQDFRRLLERADVHVIMNGTPDHWHAFINVAALRAGKDVYSETPLTLTIDEGKRLVAASRSTGRLVQTGSQQRSDPRFRLACELVRNARIGKLKHILVGLPKGPRDGPFAVKPVPPELDWNFWQGQTPLVPYVPERCHGAFRHWWDYSGGMMTDWGAHHNDVAQWANGTERSGPIDIIGKQLIDMIPGGYTASAQFRVIHRFANGVTMTITSNAEFDTARGGGVKFEGSDGWILVSREKIKASQPELLAEPLPSNAVRLARAQGTEPATGEIASHETDSHIRNFFECIRSRQQPICEAEIGHRSASICHLGTISIRLGRQLHWHPEKEVFLGDKEANAMLAREQREPWTFEMV